MKLPEGWVLLVLVSVCAIVANVALWVGALYMLAVAAGN